MTKYLYIVFSALLPIIAAKGQVIDRQQVIQVTGIISGEDKAPVPGVSVISFKFKKGSVSEASGIYSLISLPGDTILFRALGYKSSWYIVPMDVPTKLFNKDILMFNDTIAIRDVMILPWRNYDEFKREVLAARPVKPEIQNMYDNLASIQRSLLNSTNYAVSPEAGFAMAMQSYGNTLYSRGQSPVNNLLNPFAWSKFINGLKTGMLKNQKSTTTSSKPAKIKKKKKK